MGLLNLNSRDLENGAERQSDDSAKAVAGYEAGAGSRHNSDDDLAVGADRGGCSCGVDCKPDDNGWTCVSCGEYIGVKTD